MSDYKGIKISDEVIIVENRHGQGYVVDKGNTKMLETARWWGCGYNYHNPDEYKEHEYKNGKFRIRLKETAGYSSQGGNLSFWNCGIIAPDGKVFKVGINADLLLDVLLSNTFENGYLDKDVWLGRVGGQQVGVFTENMKSFVQAQLDAKERASVKAASNKYEIGDEVKTLTKTQIYAGTGYKYFEFYDNGWRTMRIRIYRKPLPVHIYAYNSDKGLHLSFYESFEKNKLKRVKTGNKYDVDLSKVFNESYAKHTKEFCSVADGVCSLMYGLYVNPYTPEILITTIDNILSSKGPKYLNYAKSLYNFDIKYIDSF